MTNVENRLLDEEMLEKSSFAKKVLDAFHQKDVQCLSNLYTSLSEEEDITKAKLHCVSLYTSCFENIVACIQNKKESDIIIYYAWHFLQLMTSYPLVKSLLENNETLLPLLIKFNQVVLDSEEKQKSLRLTSLNYILFMLGGADDHFYNHVGHSNVIPYLYELLNSCEMTADDEFFQSILLAVNLLLEGSVSCKNQLYNLKFDELVSKKMHDRYNCHIELLKVTNLTYQKLLLLKSDHQAFVEEFRRNYDSEAKKQVIYQEVKCSNKDCVQAEIEADDLKRCSRCKIATYCSKECQKTHWKKSHSKECKAQ